ncbi:YbdK family carboxylate-amine ligase [Kribbella capetownensis]|uniref:Putative glutamate--cysteine ligase 2 n=1 Tax=Kribbella capetownensis TaxID=1572659 RepID=A0A4R0JE04_9ACTN|nr:glutamate--cysteine ligase [Kribbella capetownensis]TCC44170.1 YbdK family carboxylate-amine ligase [Kribbella capetownensis]
MRLPFFGVEEELLLVSATGHPLPRSKAVVAGVQDLDVELELTRAMVEINTPVCETSTELRAHLSDMRSKLADAAAAEGARLLAIAVPPHGQAAQSITRKPRYEELAGQWGLLAREQGVCGCHVHVDVTGKETAVRVSNHLRPWLPVLLALTTNSPIYLDQDTGFASWRWLMTTRWPCAGPPPYLESVEHYDALVAMHLAAGTLIDERMVYWDIRPSSHLPTVEVRVSDVPLTIDETVLLATLIRALVMTALDDGTKGPSLEPEVLRAAYWLAARDGMTGNGLDVRTAESLPMAEVVERLRQHVEPALQELDALDLVTDGIQRILTDGNGAVKQRKAFCAGGDVTDVTEITPAPKK